MTAVLAALLVTARGLSLSLFIQVPEGLIDTLDDLNHIVDHIVNVHDCLHRLLIGRALSLLESRQIFWSPHLRFQPLPRPSPG